MKNHLMIALTILIAAVTGNTFAEDNAVKANEDVQPIRIVTVDETVKPMMNEMQETFFMHPMEVNLMTGETETTLDVPENGNLKLVLYDRLGRVVNTLHDGDMEAGRHTFVFREYRLPIETFYLRVSFESANESVDKRVFL